MKTSLFQVIDFDRVIFNTEKFSNALTDALALQSPEVAEELRLAFDGSYAKGETFFLMRRLREALGVKYDSFIENVVNKAGGGGAFLYPGVWDRFKLADELTTYRPSFGILTYGDEDDQRLKLRLVGLQNVPVVITSTPNKSEVMQGWRTDNGGYSLPAEFGGGTVQQLTLEDDKLRAFSQMPEGVSGIWINTLSEGETPDRVVRVSSLQASIDYLKTLRDA